MADKTRSAVALRYDPDGGDPAPRVVAQGDGPIAEEILRLARKHSVTMRQDPALAAVLSQLDLGASIPPELFQAVAEVLAFVYQVNEKAR